MESQEVPAAINISGISSRNYNINRCSQGMNMRDYRFDCTGHLVKSFGWIGLEKCRFAL